MLRESYDIGRNPQKDGITFMGGVETLRHHVNILIWQLEEVRLDKMVKKWGIERFIFYAIILALYLFWRKCYWWVKVLLYSVCLYLHMKKQKSNHMGSSPPLYNGGNQDFKQGMLVVLCWSRWHVDRYETCFVFVFVFKLELWLLIKLLLLLIFIQLESTQVTDYFDKSC